MKEREKERKREEEDRVDIRRNRRGRNTGPESNKE